MFNGRWNITWGKKKLAYPITVHIYVVKLADNVYFGAKDLPSFAKLFSTILSRIHTADLRIKPSKLRLNIQSADILGLHWSKGKLSPSLHKLDPLAVCEPP